MVIVKEFRVPRGAVLPDPSSPEFPATLASFAGVILIAVGLMLRLPREDVEWLGFLGAFGGAAFGFAIYLFGLVTNLY